MDTDKEQYDGPDEKVIGTMSRDDVALSLFQLLDQVSFPEKLDEMSYFFHSSMASHPHAPCQDKAIPHLRLHALCRFSKLESWRFDASVSENSHTA
jgi:hypothetical protein